MYSHIYNQILTAERFLPHIVVRVWNRAVIVTVPLATVGVLIYGQSIPQFAHTRLQVKPEKNDVRNSYSTGDEKEVNDQVQDQ